MQKKLIMLILIVSVLISITACEAEVVNHVILKDDSVCKDGADGTTNVSTRYGNTTYDDFFVSK